MQNNCYKFEKYIFEKPIFKKTIDATYIIYLENNGRLNNIKEQLYKYKPTETIYICFNKGYKKCKKDEFITNPTYDLVDAYLQIFKHADKMNYNNILILEDDFIFSEEILNQKHINNINNFLINHNNKIYQYYLGCIPYLLIPYDHNNYRSLSTVTHSVIYSKKYREYILNVNQKMIIDWDYYNGTKLLKYKYCYYKPLCYQLFTETENSQYWGKNTVFKDFSNIYTKLIMFIFNKLNMDKKPEPGFTYFYIFAKLLFIILFLLFCFIIIKLFKKI